eukprot:CAMPEP_0194400558 /NCGR_PEP_ID=MMETSP0174-20130528/127300_1 /TAXON_ID=216777 /ORGANISM="Proboscia alata, Strain PI-D3" /LENGTH=213 /DNA_ID=CAMNT_0039197127 /DNA_START=46 /DNA_END=687 /DNA_ORIENTATION=-
MNYGQRGRDLLMELKRSDFIPPYSDDGVRAALKEASLHFDELTDLANATSAASSSTAGSKRAGGPKGPPTHAKPAFLLHATAIKRNKRCLLAYHAHRINNLRLLRWEGTSILPPQIRSLLSETECEFFDEYDRLLSKQSMNIDLDLSSDLTPPLDEDFVSIRVVKSGIGTIVVEGGKTICLDDVGTIHHVRRCNDVVHLIRQGALQQLDCEEN